MNFNELKKIDLNETRRIYLEKIRIYNDASGRIALLVHDA